jgi:chromosome segregation ATPase
MKAYYKIVVIVALLVIISGLSYYKYIMALRERDELSRNLEQVKADVARLDVERQAIADELKKQKTQKEQLMEQKDALEAELQVAQDKLAELAKLEAQVQPLQQTIEGLEQDNTALLQEKEALNRRLDEIAQEKAALEARLRSIAELKKAIKEAKINSRRERIQSRQRTDTEISGNRGYIVKNGMPTYRPKITIEVISAP